MMSPNQVMQHHYRIVIFDSLIQHCSYWLKLSFLHKKSLKKKKHWISIYQAEALMLYFYISPSEFSPSEKTGTSSESAQNSKRSWVQWQISMSKVLKKKTEKNKCLQQIAQDTYCLMIRPTRMGRRGSCHPPPRFFQKFWKGDLLCDTEAFSSCSFISCWHFDESTVYPRFLTLHVGLAKFQLFLTWFSIFPFFLCKILLAFLATFVFCGDDSEMKTSDPLKWDPN